jgi:D-amino-acid dehydrogenase
MATRSGPFQLSLHPSLVPWMTRFVHSAGASRHAIAGEQLRSLARASFASHARYADHGLDTGFTRFGMLDVFNHRASFKRASGRATGQVKGGSVLSVAEIRAHVRGLDTSGLAGGVLYQEEGQCDAIKLCQALEEACRSRGVEFSYGTMVTRLLGAGGRVIGVDAVDSTRTAGHVVLAAGTWSRDLAATIGVSLPIEPGVGYTLDLEPGVDDSSIPIAFADRRIVATPYRDRLRVSGMMLLTGSNARIDEKRVEALRLEATRMMPHLRDRRIMRVTLGRRPCTPDGLPVIGTPKGRPGLVLATGHGQSGIILAPATGRLIQEQLTGSGSSQRDTAFAPDRFRAVRAIELGRVGGRSVRDMTRR